MAENDPQVGNLKVPEPKKEKSPKVQASTSAPVASPPAPESPVNVPSTKLQGRSMVTAIPLPSRGIPYNGKLPDGRVLISSMTVADEKMMAARTSNTADKTNILFNRATDLGEVKPDELLLADRFYLLLKLRSLSYGSNYAFQCVCEECSTQFRHTVNLETSLKEKVLPDGWEEPFAVELPGTGRVVGCRLLRGKDERAIAALVKKKQQRDIADPGHPSYALLLARTVVTIDGEDVTEMPALQFTENLPVRDRMAITDTINAQSPGYDPELEIECPNCGFINEAVLPMSTEFFRPKHST